MKSTFIIGFLFTCVALQAQSISASSQINWTITIPTEGYDIRFSVTWFGDDRPLNSAPGRIELLQGSTLVGRVVASSYADSGASFSITGRGTVDSVSSAMSRYTPGGAPADGFLSATWHLVGLSPGTYTLRTWSYETYDRVQRASTVWTETSFDGGSSPAPVNRAPSVAWTAIPGSIGNGEGYYVAAHGHDEDGNLAQVNVWKNGSPFALAGGGNGSDGDSGNWTSDSGPQTVTYTAQAVDAAGAVSAVIVFTVTVTAPASVQHALTTSADNGGSVSPGGTFESGTTVTVSASPDGSHEFAGWSGDAGGMVNPLAVVMDRAKSVHANFAPKHYTLVTSASGGGTVTPGGSYPFGTSVVVSATPDATYRFLGWSGDASGTAPSIAVTMTRSLGVHAVFESKATQTILFPPIGDQSVGATIPLSVTSSSGLPVTLAIVGPAQFSGGVLTLSGPGMVTIQATQMGDSYFLPAEPITRTLNATVTAQIRYRATGRIVFQSGRMPESIPYVIQPNP